MVSIQGLLLHGQHHSLPVSAQWGKSGQRLEVPESSSRLWHIFHRDTTALGPLSHSYLSLMSLSSLSPCISFNQSLELWAFKLFLNVQEERILYIPYQLHKISFHGYLYFTWKKGSLLTFNDFVVRTGCAIKNTRHIH